MRYFSRLLLLPVGSFEYHGRMLPPETDTVVATEVTKALAAELRSKCGAEVVIVALPALAYGVSTEHTGQPDTAVIATTSFFAFVRDLTTSLGLPRDFFVLVNAHGGNRPVLHALEAEFNALHLDRKMYCAELHARSVRAISEELIGDIEVHAGSFEASLVSYYTSQPLRSYDVRVGPHVTGSLRFFGSSVLAPEGVVSKSGHITADPGIGATLHNAIVQALSADIVNTLQRLDEFIAEHIV